MKHDENLETFFFFLRKNDISLSLLQEEKLSLYYKSLVQYAKKHRIVSRNDLDHIINKHFLSSFYFVKRLEKEITKDSVIADLGSGAGFPGIILSVFFNENKIFMIDSVRKKTLFLGRIVKQLELNAVVVNERIESYLDLCETKFDIFTARALASIDKLVEITKPAFKKGSIHTIKGMDFRSEMVDCKDKIAVKAEEIENQWENYSPYLANKAYLRITAK